MSKKEKYLEELKKTWIENRKWILKKEKEIEDSKPKIKGSE